MFMHAEIARKDAFAVNMFFLPAGCKIPAHMYATPPCVGDTRALSVATTLTSVLAGEVLVRGYAIVRAGADLLGESASSGGRRVRMAADVEAAAEYLSTRRYAHVESANALLEGVLECSEVCLLAFDGANIICVKHVCVFVFMCVYVCIIF